MTAAAAFHGKIILPKGITRQQFSYEYWPDIRRGLMYWKINILLDPIYLSSMVHSHRSVSSIQYWIKEICYNAHQRTCSNRVVIASIGTEVFTGSESWSLGNFCKNPGSKSRLYKNNWCPQVINNGKLGKISIFKFHIL